MPSIRLAFPEIQTWTPAVSEIAAESGKLFILEGMNYYFDAKGPRSGFGASLYDSHVLDSGIYPMQSIKTDDRTLIFAETAVWEDVFELSEDAETDELLQRHWSRIIEWEEYETVTSEESKWTHAYVGYTDYFCFPSKGIFRLASDTMTQYNVAGVPANPISIIENSGRLVILDSRVLTYSAPFDGENLVPELGGAGFQVIAELIPGKAVALLPFEGGFYVFTESGALLAEYVAGEVVYRFDRVETKQIPISNSAWTMLDDGSSIFVSSQGLYVATSAGKISPVAELFNEFFRNELIKDDYIVALTYDSQRDMLFVQVADGTAHFNHTYALRLKLDKWGILSYPHRGIIRLSAESDSLGFANLDGTTTLLSFDSAADNSYIKVGYLRPAAEAKSADSQYELQEIIIGTGAKQSTTYAIVDLNKNHNFISYNIGFYSNRDDFNLYGPKDYAKDYNIVDEVDEDYNLLLSLDSVDYAADFLGEVSIDYNDASGAEDYSLTPVNGVPDADSIDFQQAGLNHDYYSPYSMLNDLSYSLQVNSSLDGWPEELRVDPALALKNPYMDLWTLFSHGHNHSLTVSASGKLQKFHMTSLEVTAHYAGQVS